MLWGFQVEWEIGVTKNLANVDLNLLVALDALLRERNVTRAAERLMVGQSAMSSTLRRLRSLFNDQLLVREGRGLTPTPLALSLMDPVREALDIIQSVLVQRNEFDPAVDERSFTICTSDYVTLVLIQPLIEKLDEIAPNVTINIVPLGTDDYMEDLRRQRAEFLILPPELIQEDYAYRSETLFNDDYLVAAAADHPEIDGEISLEQFCELPYVTYRSGRNPALVDTQLDQLQISRSVEVTAQSFVLAPMLLPGSRMIMLIHRQLGKVFVDRLGLQLLDPPMQLRQTAQVMLWNSSHTDDAAHSWLRGQLLETARSIVEEGSLQPKPRD